MRLPSIILNPSVSRPFVFCIEGEPQGVENLDIYLDAIMGPCIPSLVPKTPLLAWNQAKPNGLIISLVSEVSRAWE